MEFLDSEGGDFDADAAFQDTEPDFLAVAKRERENELAAEKLLQERLRVEADRQRLKEEAFQLEQKQRLERQQALDQRIEREQRLLPERMVQIRADEERFGDPSSSPIAFTAQELGLSPIQAASLHHQDPQTAEGGSDDEGDGSFDHFVHSGMRRLLKFLEIKPKLDDLPEGKDRLQAPLCQLIYRALQDGLYAYDRALSRNLENPLTKRLYTYYRYIQVEKFEYVDTADAWKKIMQVALAHRPATPGPYALSTICRNYDLTMGKEGEFSSGQKPNVYRPSEQALLRALYDKLKKQEARLGQVVILQRDITRNRLAKERMEVSMQILQSAAGYFVMRPEKEEVCLLRSVALGRKILDSPALVEQWLDAVDRLSYHMLPNSSGLLRRASELARSTVMWDY